MVLPLESRRYASTHVPNAKGRRPVLVSFNSLKSALRRRAANESEASNYSDPMLKRQASSPGHPIELRMPDHATLLYEAKMSIHNHSNEKEGAPKSRRISLVFAYFVIIACYSTFRLLGRHSSEGAVASIASITAVFALAFILLEVFIKFKSNRPPD